MKKLKSDNKIEIMFQQLKNNIENNVVVKYWKDEKLKESEGKLLRVYDFDGITILSSDSDLLFISFIDYNSAIVSIESESNVLYENSLFQKQLKKIENEEEFFKMEKEVYGKDYVNPEEFKSRSYLIKNGLKEIDASLENDWINFVDRNSGFNVKIVQAVISMLNKINSGMSFHDAEIIVYGEEFNLYGFDTKKVDDALKYFCKNKKEYNEYIKEVFDCVTGSKKVKTKIM